ncbi:MAG: membrane integrity-associated transporter subunit PqiC [Pseudomonadales bacterium]|nr:membrane integrity-associated transporter subunit PqiC [Pseudomonadales bacterium]
MSYIRRTLLISMLGLLTACSSGTSTSYYLLEPVIEAPVNINDDISLEILDLEIPQYMERFQIASRRSDNQVVFSTSSQWGENLRKNITRVMARNLIHELETSSIGTPGSRLNVAADFKTKIYIERFERGADGYVQLVARWQLMDANSQTLSSRSYRSSGANRIDPSDYASTVASMSELLGEFSRELAGTIRSVQ